MQRPNAHPPPPPEKSASVAERARLLRTSFRKEDADKPRIPEKPVSPMSEKTASVVSNGERSPSPGQSSGQLAGGMPRYISYHDKPSYPDTNKDASGKTAVSLHSKHSLRQTPWRIPLT